MILQLIELREIKKKNIFFVIQPENIGIAR